MRKTKIIKLNNKSLKNQGFVVFYGIIKLRKQIAGRKIEMLTKTVNKYKIRFARALPIYSILQVLLT